jgi:imidazoleglycerol-phosphate dehydratase
MCAVDISGRSHLSFSLDIPTERVGDFDTELVEEFFTALTREAGITLHIKKLDGKNSHHIIEGAFKAFARALRIAVAIDPTLGDEVPSTKGVL